MGVNKNFIVKNGLQVADQLIFTDVAKNSVGIGTSIVNHRFHVIGGIGASTLTVTGLSTFTTLEINYSNIGVSTASSLHINTNKVLSVESSQLTLSGIQTIDATTKASLERELAIAPNDFSDINVTGISTFTNGPMFIGSGTSTGTASQRLQVTGGAYVSGNLGIGTTNPTSALTVVGNASLSGDLTFTGNNDIYLGDNGVINFGASNDLQIFHNGSVSVIRDGGTGGLLIDSDNEIKLAKNGTGNDNLAVFTPDGSVELYYDNSKKFETTGAGVTVYGTTQSQQLNVSGVSTFSNTIEVGTGKSLTFGDAGANYLKLYSDGTNTYIKQDNVGKLIVDATGAQRTLEIIDSQASQTMAKFLGNGGAVELYHNNTKRLETTGYGVTVYGTLEATGIATASSFKGSAQVGIATAGGYLGLTTQFKFVGSGVTITSEYDANIGITTLTFIGGAGGGIPGGSNNQVQFNNAGSFGGSSNFTFDGSNVSVSGIITATSYGGSGSNLTGIVTFITAGSGISVNQNTGNVTITATGGGGGSSQWETTAAGINTTSNVGIGSTIPTSKLDVSGDAKFTGIVTATDFNSSSDITLKQNVQTFENALDVVSELRGVRFEWKENQKPSVGVIAQELETVLPELVSDTNPKSVNYSGIIGVLIEAVKELSEEVKILKDKINNQ